MRILGIDPGSVVSGYGVIDEGNAGKITLVEYGVVKARKKSEIMTIRLREIFLRIERLIERTQPDAAVFESMFYAKNAQSLIKLSQARAAAILPTALAEMPIFEYSPKEVKKSVTGNGNASKVQVQYMVKKLLNIEETHEFFDATDALAIAICHSVKSKMPSSSSKSWADFIKNNPDRVVK